MIPRCANWRVEQANKQKVTESKQSTPAALGDMLIHSASSMMELTLWQLPARALFSGIILRYLIQAQADATPVGESTLHSNA
jgi:hypothetical protein